MNNFLFVIPVLLLFSYPLIYNKFPRSVKDIIRLTGGIIVGQSIILGIKGYLLYSILIFAVLFLFRKIFNIDRKNNAQKACLSCPELLDGQICSGYEKQAVKIRLLEENFCKNRVPIGRRYEYD